MKSIINFVAKDKTFYIVLALSFMVYVYMLHPRLGGTMWTDVRVHAEFVLKWLEQGFEAMPMNFLYFGTVAIFAGLQKSIVILYIASAVVLSIMWAAKYSVSRYIITDCLRQQKVDISERETTIKVFAFLLTFVMHIPLNSILYRQHVYFYLAELMPNTWHNSTTIFMLPFSTLLFYLAYKKIFLEKENYTKYINLLAIVCFFIKPNFTLCFSPIYFLCIAYKYRLNREFWYALPAVIVPLLLLATQSLHLFSNELGGQYAQKNNGGITIALFQGWNAQMRATDFVTYFKFLFAFLGIYTFPIIYGIVYKKYSKLQLLSLFFVLTALSILILFAEIANGDYNRDGNFLWQVVMCNYIMMLVFLTHFLKKIFSRQIETKDIVVGAIFFAHFVSGFLYIMYIIINKAYS
ncbi:hypothetical protein WAF17_06800 [Bernardetia sp. ABR2-2B]|uniref:hypothetical protein n=1 Tax=Bernardetia sp. ABR2-2B TaxID=3127472 RepID=UPI0030CC6706